MDLIFDPSKQQRPHRLLLYGVPGIGKSTWGSQAPHAIIIPTEDGLRQIECQSFPLTHDFDVFRSYVAGLATSEHPYKTLVIDSADWLEKLIWRDVAKSNGKEGIEDIGYGKGYQYAAEAWGKMLDYIEIELNIKKQMTVIFIAHSQVIKHTDPATDSYDRYAPRLHKLADAMLREWCDDVLFVNRKTYTQETKEGFNKTKVKVSGGIQRVMYTTERPSHLAKNRLKLDEEMPFEWAALAKHLPCLPKE